MELDKQMNTTAQTIIESIKDNKGYKQLMVF